MPIHIYFAGLHARWRISYAPRMGIVFFSSWSSSLLCLFFHWLFEKYFSYLNLFLWNSSNAIGCYHVNDTRQHTKLICNFSRNKILLLFSLLWMFGALRPYNIVFHSELHYALQKRWAKYWTFLSFCFGLFLKILLQNSISNVDSVGQTENVTVWVAFLNAFQFIIMKMLFVYLFTILYCVRDARLLNTQRLSIGIAHISHRYQNGIHWIPSERKKKYIIKQINKPRQKFPRCLCLFLVYHLKLHNNT